MDLNGHTLPRTAAAPEPTPAPAPADDGPYKPEQFCYDPVYGFVYFEYGGKVYYNDPGTDNWINVTVRGEREPFPQPVDSSVLPTAAVRNMPNGTHFYFNGRFMTVQR